MWFEGINHVRRPSRHYGGVLLHMCICHTRYRVNVLSDEEMKEEKRKEEEEKRRVLDTDDRNRVYEKLMKHSHPLKTISSTRY